MDLRFAWDKTVVYVHLASKQPCGLRWPRGLEPVDSLYPIYVVLLASLLVVSACSGMKERTAVKDGSVQSRIAGRTFPSVFQAWNPADNLPGEDALVTAARHDLIFHGASFFGLRWDHAYSGLATGFTQSSIAQGLARREKLLELNPNLVLLMEIRYRDAHRSFMPEDHEWWRRDANGALVMGWEEGGYIQLDFSNPAYRAHVAQRARAAVESGVVDGVMLDWWRDDADRLALIEAVREAVGEDALILANANDRTMPQSAHLINGYFMECTRSATAGDWRRIADTLAWAEKNLREPRINCLETWYHVSREDLHLMRATTTLSLTLSDGYCLFSDPNPLPTPDHLHNWYAFWDHDLGKALAPGEWREDGSVIREFAKGTVVYNPMGNRTVTVSFDKPKTSAATGTRAREHSIAPGDGDIYMVE